MKEFHGIKIIKRFFKEKLTEIFVCTFSWKQNKYYTIPKCKIRGFIQQ